MLPADHLLVPEAHALPAIVVVKTPNGGNHFVVVWSVVGPWVQVMDPAQGRHWISRSALFDRLYIHQASVPAAAWRELGRGAGVPGHARCPARGARHRRRGPRPAVRRGAGQPGLAGDGRARRRDADDDLDGGERRRATRRAVPVAHRAAGRARAPMAEYPLISASTAVRGGRRRASRGRGDCWRARRVLVRARGRRERPYAAAAIRRGHAEPPAARPLPTELAAALTEAPVRPWRTLLDMLVADGIATPVVLGMVLVVSAALVTVNAILLRGFLEIGQQLGLASQRAAAMATLIGVAGARPARRAPAGGGALRLGRMLDVRLRMAFLAQDPAARRSLLSEPTAVRHGRARTQPAPGSERAAARLRRMLGAAAQLAAHRRGDRLVAAVERAARAGRRGGRDRLAARLPAADGGARSPRAQPCRCARPVLPRRAARPVADSRARRPAGDAAPAGSAAGRSGCAPVCGYYAASTIVEGALALCGLGMAVVMVWSVASHSSSGLLLLVYWALSLPALGQEIAILARQYPVLRNVVARLLEPLGTPEPGARDRPVHRRICHAAGRAIARGELRGAAIRMSGVSVEAGGNTVLEDVDLTHRARRARRDRRAVGRRQVEPGRAVARLVPAGARHASRSTPGRSSATG